MSVSGLSCGIAEYKERFRRKNVEEEKGEEKGEEKDEKGNRKKKKKE